MAKKLEPYIGKEVMIYLLKPLALPYYSVEHKAVFPHPPGINGNGEKLEFVLDMVQAIVERRESDKEAVAVIYQRDVPKEQLKIEWAISDEMIAAVAAAHVDPSLVHRQTSSIVLPS